MSEPLDNGGRGHQLTDIGRTRTATDEYRNGWDKIWGHKEQSNEPNHEVSTTGDDG
jgi:hypothetical protein